MKASTLVLVAVYCMGISAAFADASQAPNDQRGPADIVVGERLAAAKSKLVKQGWKPTRMHTTDGYEYSGVEKELAAHKFFELDNCSLIVRAASCTTRRKEFAYASIPSVSNSMT